MSRLRATRSQVEGLVVDGQALGFDARDVEHP